MKFFSRRFRPGFPKFIRGIHPRKITKRVSRFIERKPYTSFFLVLGLFLLLMILGNVLLSPKATPQAQVEAPKEVRVFKLGSAPKELFQGKVEKSGVIKIVAQTPGVVSNINVTEGQSVGQGTNILSLATNYSGGNALSVSRQIAQTQYNNAKDSYPDQKKLIDEQKQLADQNKDNASKMRDIAASSASDSRTLLSQNQTFLDYYNKQLQTASNPNDLNDPFVRQTLTTIMGYEQAVNGLNASIRSLELQSSDSSKDIASSQHVIAIKQLEIQEKALNMNLEISKLSYRLAAINEATMFPVAPFPGKIEKIFVHVGDNVTPGTVLASLSGDTQHVEVVVSVPAEVARNISRIENSRIYYGKYTIDAAPTYVSQDATSGTLYSVIYQLDDLVAPQVTNASYVTVDIPIGTGNTTNDVPFIPLDSVTQTQEEAFVYVVGADGKAKALKVQLGQIQGNFVEVTSGLPKESQVIMDRNVIEGDKLKVIE